MIKNFQDLTQKFSIFFYGQEQILMSNYGKAQYWQDRYSKKNEPFDWYQRFYAIKQQIRTQIPVSLQAKILIPGCGTSRLGQELIEQGYGQVFCIDNAGNCIKNMLQKYKEITDSIKLQQMDAKSLTFQSEYFDGIIDKALYDCIMCSQNAQQNAYKMLCEFYRVLKKGGTYLMLSYQPPTRRLPMLEKSHFNWKVIVQKIPKPSSNSSQYSILDEGQETNYHYLYICRKQQGKK